MLPRPPANNVTSGATYFIQGIKLLWHPQLRLYILVPLLVNCILFLALTAVFIHNFGALIDSATNALPSWLAPLAWIALVVIGVLALIVYGYSFNLITNIIAAPFYGLLAEKAEALLTGEPIDDESLWHMIPRVLLRELAKLWYFLSRGIVVILVILLIGTIPLINFLAPVLGLAWSAWSMSIQYADYAADNNQLEFQELRQRLWVKKYSSLGFGTMIMACSVIPILNIFAMPAAVTGGTIYWVAELKNCRSKLGSTRPQAGAEPPAKA